MMCYLSYVSWNIVIGAKNVQHLYQIGHKVNIQIYKIK